MSRYDTIKDVTVAKTFDEIVEVKKFNPFHDAAGKFSSSNGFKSYSANPNTRAGAMAIARSAAAGHGSTMNVHRDSKGETIRRNANWLARGAHGVPTGTQGSSVLRRVIEPTGGLSGASAAGSSWQYQNQQAGRTTTGGKQPAQKPAQQQATQKPQQTQQTQQKPAQQAQQQQQQAQQQPQQQSSGSLAANTQGVTLSTGEKLAIVPRSGSGQSVGTTHKVTGDHYQDRVAGKDISKTAKVNSRGSKDPIDQIAEQQGWNKASTVTNDLETFQKAAKQSGKLVIRTVDTNHRTGESAMDVCKKTMTDGNAALGGGGGKVYGSGLYMVGSDISNVPAGKAMSRKIAGSQSESFYYGSTQMMATVQPGTKIATPSQARSLDRQFRNMSTADRARFGNDRNAYIASKGYDGAQWHSNDTPYITMYNKSSIIYYGGASTYSGT